MAKQPGTEEEQELDANGNPIEKAEQPTIDWEADDNPYKKRYTDSQGQVAPLANTLKQFAEYDHNTKSWKPKAQSQQTQQTDEDVEKLLEGYDPDFKKSLKVYTQKQIDSALQRYNENNTFMSNYNSGVTNARAKAISEFGGEYELATKDGQFNANSPLYKIANDILTKDYAEFNADGTFKRYTRPDAEYKAIAEAYAVIQKRSKVDPNFGKTKLGAIQGKGTAGGSGKKSLSFEEYDKMSSEEKDAYDLQHQVGLTV
jgi:hypothetical protein